MKTPVCRFIASLPPVPYMNIGEAMASDAEYFYVADDDCADPEIRRVYSKDELRRMPPRPEYWTRKRLLVLPQNAKLTYEHGCIRYVPNATSSFTDLDQAESGSMLVIHTPKGERVQWMTGPKPCEIENGTVLRVNDNGVVFLLTSGASLPFEEFTSNLSTTGFRYSYLAPGAELRAVPNGIDNRKISAIDPQDFVEEEDVQSKEAKQRMHNQMYPKGANGHQSDIDDENEG